MIQEIIIDDIINPDRRSGEIATRSSWINYPINDPEVVDINLSFSKEEFEKVIKGFLPCQMEDKWFIFYENEHLYFHRSWTGYGIFKVKIINQNDTYLIKELLVEKSFNKQESCKDIFICLIQDKLLRD